MTYNNAAARLSASEEPTPGRWPLSAGGAADGEDAEDDWGEGTHLTFADGVDRDGRPCAVDVCVLDDDTAA